MITHPILNLYLLVLPPEVPNLAPYYLIFTFLRFLIHPLRERHSTIYDDTRDIEAIAVYLRGHLIALSHWYPFKKIEVIFIIYRYRTHAQLKFNNEIVPLKPSAKTTP